MPAKVKGAANLRQIWQIWHWQIWRLTNWDEIGKRRQGSLNMSVLAVAKYGLLPVIALGRWFWRAEHFFNTASGKGVSFGFNMGVSTLVAGGGALLAQNAVATRKDRVPRNPHDSGRDEFYPRNSTQQNSWTAINTGFTLSGISTGMIGFTSRNPGIALSNLGMAACAPFFHRAPGFFAWATLLGVALPSWPYSTGGLPKEIIAPPESASFPRRFATIFVNNVKAPARIFRNPMATIFSRSGHAYYTLALAGSLLMIGAGTLLLDRFFSPPVVSSQKANGGALKRWGYRILKSGFFFDALGMLLLGFRTGSILKVLGGAMILSGTPWMNEPLGRAAHSLGTGMVFYSFGLDSNVLPGRLAVTKVFRYVR